MKKTHSLLLVAVLVFIGGFGGYQAAQAAGSGPGTASISDTTGTPAAEGPTTNVTAEKGVSDVITIILTVGTMSMNAASSSPTFDVPLGFTEPHAAGGATVPTSASEVDVDGEWFAVGGGGTCAVSMGSSGAALLTITVDVTADCAVGNTITLTYKGTSNATMVEESFNASTDRGDGFLLNVNGTRTITVADTNPTITFASSVADPTTWATFSVTSTFSESVSGFNLADIVVVGGTASSFVTTTADSVYTFNVIPNADGLLTINVATSSALDIWDNPSDAATQFSVTTDATNPTVTLASSVSGSTNVASFSVTSTFNENVTGFTISDITVVNGTASSFVTTTASTVFTFVITPTADGLVTVEVANGRAFDAAGNGNDDSNVFSITSDTTAPSTPVIAPNAGSYDSAKTIFITSAGSNSIKYTTDGTTPTCTVGTTYTAPFALSSSATVNAVGCDAALNVSSVATNVYTIASGGGGGGGGGSGPLSFFTYSNLPTPTPAVTSLPLTFLANSLVKLANDGNPATQEDSSVYYYGRDGRRHAFPNDKVYLTWYSDFTQVQVISATELTRMPLGQNVTYRPGVRMVKFTTLSRVYAVDAGGLLRWVKTEAIAQALYGSTWNQQIDDISDAFFSNYRFGNDINSTADFNPALVRAAASSIQVDMGF